MCQCRLLRKTIRPCSRLFADAELDIIVGPFSASEQSTDHIRGFEMVSDNIVAVVRASSTVRGIHYGGDLCSIPVISPKAQGTGARAEYPCRF